MAYELHIERAGKDISQEEWESAVRYTEGMRFSSGDAVAVNPTTGEEIRILAGPNEDADVLFETRGFLGFGRKKEWIRVFRLSNGRISFKGTPSVESPKDPVHRAAVLLASALGASIVGDEGETYEWKS